MGLVFGPIFLLARGVRVRQSQHREGQERYRETFQTERISCSETTIRENIDPTKIVARKPDLPVVWGTR